MLTIIAISILFIFSSYACFLVYTAHQKIPLLKKDDSSNFDNMPRVSIIFSALNEEEHIASCIEKLQNIDYENLEIIVINDRSTDKTGQILHEISQRNQQLKVVTVTELPELWLGKNHALWIGAQKATGDYLIFTDADVLFHPQTITHSIQYMLKHSLDHLTMFFKPIVRSSILNMFINETLTSLVFLYRPWLASDPKKPFFMGVGAFNCVKKSFYLQMGGHQRLKLSPLDDITLGRLIKNFAGKTDCLNGTNYISVPWYPSLSVMIKSLQKNTFAVFEYSIFMMCVGVFITFFTQILPFWLLILGSLPVKLLSMACILVHIFTLSITANMLQINKKCLFWILITPYINVYALLRNSILTILLGGIYWRSTFYSLKDLKVHAITLAPWKKLNLKS